MSKQFPHQFALINSLFTKHTFQLEKNGHSLQRHPLNLHELKGTKTKPPKTKKNDENDEMKQRE